jgi:hypothetical protein
MKVKDFNHKLIDTKAFIPNTSCFVPDSIRRRTALESANAYNFYLDATTTGVKLDIQPCCQFELSDYNINILAKIAELYADLIPARDKYNNTISR